MYYEPRLHYLQNFVSLVEQNPGMFHSGEGDDNFDMPPRGEEQIIEVTKGQNFGVERQLQKEQSFLCIC